MVKRTRLLSAIAPLLIVPLLFSLFACELFIELFALSPFPGYLSQAVASVDLRSRVEMFLGDDYSEWESDVHVLRNSSAEYVFLIVRKVPGGQRVYAFDTSLGYVAADSVDKWSNLRLVDANDDFIAGHVRFDGATLVTTQDYPTIGYEWSRGFSDGTNNYLLWVDSQNLQCAQFNASWTTPPSNTQASLGAAESMSLEGIGHDASQVYLFFRGYDSSSDDDFLQIVTTDEGYYPALASDVFSNPDFVSARVYGVRPERRVYYTRKGVVVQTQNRGRYYLLSLDGRIKKRFYLSKEDEIPLGFDLDGDYYYVFDAANYRLYKAATGF